jgi:hypothetical protein
MELGVSLRVAACSPVRMNAPALFVRQASPVLGKQTIGIVCHLCMGVPLREDPVGKRVVWVRYDRVFYVVVYFLERL